MRKESKKEVIQLLGNKIFNPELLRYKSYKKPKFIKPMDDIYGYDTETDINGNIICACLHNGKVLDHTNLASSLCSGNISKINLITYNINFELNLLLKQIPEQSRNELRTTGKTEYNRIKYKLLGKKYLCLSLNKKRVHIWDIAQFYYMSLDNASSKYLGINKAYIPYEEITPQYAADNLQSIQTACIQHAYLTYKLAIYFFHELDKMDIKVNKIFSTASISSKAFHQNCNWQDLTILYKHRLDYVHAFQNSYAGGMFVNPVRGGSYLYLYDVVSMYPAYIAKIKEIKGAIYTKATDYQPKAYYASLLCRINITDTNIQPVGLLCNMTRYYPAGHFVKWITKQEYDYLIKYDYKVTILQGYWIIPRLHFYPFKKYIHKLVSLKSQYKGKDAMKYNLVKIIMNSFYGKTIQLFPRQDNTIEAGVEYNPIYASYITSSARVLMCEVARKIPGLTFAIHTDSLITDKPLPADMLGSELGNLDYVCEGEGIMVAPGMYEVGDKTKTRSFGRYKVVDKIIGDKPFRYLDYFIKYPSSSKIKLKLKLVYSWRLGTIQHNEKDIGRFIEQDKEIDLNGFNMRNWLSKTTGIKLLTIQEKSLPFLENILDSDKQILKTKGISVNPHFMFENKINPAIIKNNLVTQEEFDKQREEETN